VSRRRDQAHSFTLINTFKVRELKAFVVSVNPVFHDVVYVGNAAS
jgi:hypothetical protein